MADKLVEEQLKIVQQIAGLLEKLLQTPKWQ